MFKQYRINRLKIKVAVYEALEADSRQYVQGPGDISLIFINKHQEHLAQLVKARLKLAILEGK